MKHLFRTLFLAFLITSGTALLAQEEQPEPMDILLERFDKHQRLLPQEKLYLHLEKENLEDGAHLWFKIYLVAGAKHRPSPISTGAHVELIDPDGNIIEKRYIKVNRGLGYGDLSITENVLDGTYRIKAYTDWMKNFDWEYIPEQEFFIKEDFFMPPAPVFCELNFFPEGGQWIAGFQHNIVFYAGPMDVSGTVYDDADNEITTFKSGYAGRGIISLTAEPGKSYYARLENCDEKFPLPAVQPTGLALSVKAMGDQLFRLDINTNDETADGKLLHAVIQSRGVKVNTLQFQINGSRARAIIPKRDLPAGISQITIFDENLAVLAERLIYVKRKSAIDGNFELADARADKMSVTAKLSEGENNPLQGHISAAILTEEPESLPNTIESYLNLGAELPAFENSASYFDPETGLANEHIDQLLMTKKWSWTSWKDLKLNRTIKTDRSLNTYMNEAYLERQKFSEDEEAIEALDDNVKRLDDVVVTAKKEEVEENLAVKKIYGKGDGSLDLDKININKNDRLIDILRGRMAGVYVSGNGPLTTINIRGSSTGSGDSIVRLEPLILVNNIPSDIQSILDIPANMVGSIEVFKGSRASVFGIRGAGGAIAIYTRNEMIVAPGKREQPEEEKEANVKMSYDKPATFEPDNKSNASNLRYWNPLLTTNEKGEISFTFNKPEDSTTPLYIRLQGITKAGVPFSMVRKLN